MKYLTSVYLLIYSVLFCSSVEINAAEYNSYSDLLESKETCFSSPRLCISQIDGNIVHIKKNSTHWYRLVNLKLLALWEIRDVKALKLELHKYVHLDNAPPVFLTTVYTLHSKMLFSDNETEQSTLYANKAVALIEKVNEVSFDANRYAEIIIMYNQLKQYESALEFIAWINIRIAKMGAVNHFPKLQTAIAHTYLFLDDYDVALQHFQLALAGFIEIDYPLETAESYHNVARVFQEKKDYDQAITAFNKALQWMDSAAKVGDYAIEAKNYTQLRLIETLQSNGQYDEAQVLLNDINPRQVDEWVLDLYEQVKSNKPMN